MSNIVNLQRDQHFIELGQASISWPTAATRINSSGVVNQDVGTMLSTATSTTVAGQRIGVLMQQPTGERTPYRVKVNVYSTQPSYFEVGYATTQTGTNDTISLNTRIAGFAAGTASLDEVICFDATNQSNPVYFAIQAAANSTQYNVHISVQRLNVAPPQYSSVPS